MATTNKLETLFPLPSAAPSPFCAQTLPGSSYEAKLAITEALKDNHIRWHAYINDLGFHNHCSHHLLAAYSLGARSSLIEATYNRHKPQLKAAITDVAPITPNNYYDHLGEMKFYNYYREFFTAQILQKGSKAVLEEYIFSREANVIPAGEKQNQPRMATRLLSGLLHPMIHAGNGLEFGVPGLLVEGLAQAATHTAHAPLVPDSYFDAATPAALGAPPLAFSLPFRLTLEQPHAQTTAQVGTHALDFLGRIVTNEAFDPIKMGLPKNPFAALERVYAVHGSELRAWADEWYADGKDVGAKLEELFWMNTVIYGASGWGRRETAPGGEFNADFFLMHLVTSVLFLPSYAAYLSPTSLSILMRSYFITCLDWYISLGRVPLPLSDFYASSTAHPLEHGAPHATPDAHALDASDPTPNPWLALIQSTLQHSDDHIHKLQRALLHFASRMGSTPAGTFAKAAEAGLEGADLLDGTLFVRIAGLTMARVGWMREGQENKGWDRNGIL